MTQTQLTQTQRALFGLDERCIVSHQSLLMHSEAVSHWQGLVESAKKSGFDLQAASAYRSYASQLAIWNQKASGERPLLDAVGNRLDVNELSPTECLWAIMKWSALPGASRHHWGSEFDVYDALSLPEGYRLKLTLEEAETGGVLASFYQWLDKTLPATGFHRPYYGQNSVAREPWHISCTAVSQPFYEKLERKTLYNFFSQRNDLALRDQVLQNFDEIYECYILV